MLRLRKALPTKSDVVKDYRYYQKDWKDYTQHKYWFNQVRGNRWNKKDPTGPRHCYILINPDEEIANKMPGMFVKLFEATTSTRPGLTKGLVIMAYKMLQDAKT